MQFSPTFEHHVPHRCWPAGLIPYLQGAHSLLRRIKGERETSMQDESSYLLSVRSPPSRRGQNFQRYVWFKNLFLSTCYYASETSTSASDRDYGDEVFVPVNEMYLEKTRKKEMFTVE